jgi:hypothetical protein
MIRLPWSENTAPNIMLEITDACNVSCRFCYKDLKGKYRTLAEIQADLDDAIKLRPLHTVTISGGEPTLHPDLLEIIRIIKRRNLHVFLLTNGVKIDEATASNLKEVGLDSILFHVDPGQKRQDIPESESFADVTPRIAQLTETADKAGLDVSLSFTLENTLNLTDITDYFFNTPLVSFLFIAKGVDLEKLYAEKNIGSTNKAELKVPAIIQFFKKRFNIEPYAYIPATDGGQPVWVSFFSPYVVGVRGMSEFQIRSNFSDLFLMNLNKFVTGRHVHKTSQNPKLTLFRVVVNGLTTFRLGELFRFIKKVRKAPGSLRHKMIVYDEGPRINDQGDLTRCEYCPTAIVRNGSLLPCCTADYQPTEIH